MLRYSTNRARRNNNESKDGKDGKDSRDTKDTGDNEGRQERAGCPNQRSSRAGAGRLSEPGATARLLARGSRAGATGHCAVFEIWGKSRKLRRDRSLRLESLGRRSESWAPPCRSRL